MDTCAKRRGSEHPDRSLPAQQVRVIRTDEPRSCFESIGSLHPDASLTLFEASVYRALTGQTVIVSSLASVLGGRRVQSFSPALSLSEPLHKQPVAFAALLARQWRHVLRQFTELYTPLHAFIHGGGPQISVRSSHLGSSHHFYDNSSVLVLREEFKQVVVTSASVFRVEPSLQFMRQRYDFPPVWSKVTQATGCLRDLSSLESRSSRSGTVTTSSTEPRSWVFQV